MLTRRLCVLAFVLLALAGSAWAQPQPDSLGKAVVVYNLRAAKAPLASHLAASGWAVEHWILEPPGVDLLLPEDIQRRVNDHNGRLIFVAKCEAAPVGPDQPEGEVRATADLHAYDSAAREVAAATASATGSGQRGAREPVATAVNDALAPMLEKLRNAGDGILVEKTFFLEIQLHRRAQFTAVAQPLYEAVVSELEKTKSGSGANADFQSETRRMWAEMRFTGSAEELAAVLDGVAQSDKKYRPLEKVAVLSTGLMYHFNEQQIQIQIVGMDPTLYESAQGAVEQALRDLPNTADVKLTYTKEKPALIAQVFYMGNAWQLDQSAFGPLGSVEKLKALEFQEMTARRLIYRLPTAAADVSITLLGTDDEFQQTHAAQLTELVTDLPGFTLAGNPVYDPTKKRKSWIAKGSYTGRRAALDREIFKRLQAHEAFASFHRAVSESFFALKYIRSPQAPETDFEIEIENVTQELVDGVCAELFSAVNKELQPAFPHTDTREGPLGKNKIYTITGTVNGTLTEFNSDLWSKVLLKDKRFGVFSGRKNKGDTIRLIYSETPPKTTELEIFLRGASALHYDRYGKPFLEGLKELAGVSRITDPAYFSWIFTGALADVRFEGTSLDFFKRVEAARKDRPEGRFFQAVRAVGNSIAYDFVPASEVLVLLGNVPKADVEAVAKEMEGLVAKATGGSVTGTKNADERYVLVTAPTEVLAQELLSPLAAAFSKSDRLKKAALREVYANVIEFTLPAADDPLEEPTGPFKRRFRAEEERPAQVEEVKEVADLLATVKTSSDAVVTLRTRHGGEEWSGSGVLISSRGHILTTRTAVRGDLPAQRLAIVSVRVKDRWYRGQVFEIGILHNVALVKIEGENFPSAPLGNSASVRAGDRVFCVGDLLAADWSPQGFATGIVTHLQRRWIFAGTEARVIDHSIVAHRGATGAAVFDKQGRVIGLVLGGAPVSTYTDSRSFVPVNAVTEVTRSIGF